jgi:hypothetical protein
MNSPGGKCWPQQEWIKKSMRTRLGIARLRVNNASQHTLVPMFFLAQPQATDRADNAGNSASDNVTFRDQVMGIRLPIGPQKRSDPFD